MSNEKNTNNQAELSVVLSREEVLVILRLLDVSNIPGLGEEPIPNLTDEQQALSLIVAERALRARGIAAINDEGRLLIQRAILEMLGSCAYATQSLFITHMAAPTGETRELAAHQWANKWVLHTRLDQVLHTFQQLDNWPDVAARLIDFCRWPYETTHSDHRLTVETQTLATVRDLAAAGEIERAIQLLGATGNRSNSVSALVNLLAAPHFVTVVQQVEIESSDAMSIRSITILHRDQELLVAVAPTQTEENDDRMLVIQSTSVNNLKQMLTELVTITK